MKRNMLFAPFLLVAALAFSSPVLRADEGLKKETKDTTPKADDPVKPEKPKVKPYPLTTCIVSDEKLGEMGKPVVFEHKGQEIKLCCKACRKDFDKDPAKFLKKLEPKK